jgi:hypothetical protein
MEKFLSQNSKLGGQSATNRATRPARHYRFRFEPATAAESFAVLVGVFGARLARGFSKFSVSDDIVEAADGVWDLEADSELLELLDTPSVREGLAPVAAASLESGAAMSLM